MIGGALKNEVVQVNVTNELHFKSFSGRKFLSSVSF